MVLTTEQKKDAKKLLVLFKDKQRQKERYLFDSNNGKLFPLHGRDNLSGK